MYLEPIPKNGDKSPDCPCGKLAVNHGLCPNCLLKRVESEELLTLPQNERDALQNAFMFDTSINQHLV